MYKNDNTPICITQAKSQVTSYWPNLAIGRTIAAGKIPLMPPPSIDRILNSRSFSHRTGSRRCLRMPSVRRRRFCGCAGSMRWIPHWYRGLISSIMGISHKDIKVEDTLSTCRACGLGYGKRLGGAIYEPMREAASRGFWVGACAPCGCKEVYVQDVARKPPKLEPPADAAVERISDTAPR